MKNLSYALVLIICSGCASVTEKLTNNERELLVSRKWVKELPLDTKLGPERFHGMSPLVVGDVVYQGNGKDSFAAYSRLTGAELWRRMVENGVSSGVEFKDGDLFFGGSDGQFYCLKALDGTLKWSFPVRAEVLAAPLIVEDTVYFLAANNVVYALDSKSGKQKWLYNRTDTTTFSIRGGAKPVLYKQSLLIGFSDGFFVSINAKSGGLVWERNLSRNAKFKDINATAVIDGSSVFVSSYDDSLYKLSADDGQIQWRVERGGHAAVTIQGNKVFYPTSDGDFLALDKQSGKTIWQNKVKSGIATQAIEFNELLVYGESRGDLKIVNSADGALVSSFTSGRGSPIAPAVDIKNSEVYFVSNEGNLFAIKLAWERRASRLPWEKRP